MAAILPLGKTTFTDANGNPLALGTVTFYVPSTTTLKTTWQDSGKTTPNTNPVVLDSRGQATIWGEGLYRQVVKDAAGVTIWDQVVGAESTSTALLPVVSAASTSAALTALGVSTAMQAVIAKATTPEAAQQMGVPTIFATIAALRAYSGAGTPQAIVQGYYGAGDGGEGLFYYSAGSVASDNGGTVIVDGAGRRWLRQTGGLAYSVRWFGAKGDNNGTTGNGTNDSAAFQACFDAAKTDGTSIRIPAGNYRLSTGISYTRSAGTTLFDNFPNVTGEGARITRLVFDTGSMNGITLTGTAANNLAAYSPAKISGFTLHKSDGQGNGLVLVNHLHIRVDDVICYQWNYGALCQDVQESTFINCMWVFNLHGFMASRVAFTEPNNLSFISCMCGGNQNWGYDIQGGAAVNFNGGSIESNGGVGADPVQWGVRIFIDPTTPQEGSAAATFTSVYFERNAGNGDVWYVNSGWQASLSLTGCTFNRADPMGTGLYGTNCIRVETFGAYTNTLSVTGCGFKGLGGYPLSAARPYIGIVNPAQPLIIHDVGNMYFSATEAPTWPQGAQHSAGTINGVAGTIANTKNVASFTKNGTGDYTITFAAPALNANLWLSATAESSGMARIIAAATGSIRIGWVDSTGVAANPTALSVQVHA